MSYINFKGILKKATHKPGGEVEILLIVPTQSLRGQFENLSEMIECDVIGGLDSQVVRFTKLINAKTNKPIIQYKVDDNGLVTELKKPEGEQLTADDQLGLAPEKVTIKEEPVELSLTLINDFILSGMAPNYQDLDHDFMLITRRILDGETYMKLAADEGMAMMLFNMAVDEYRQRIAPLAMKWDEWRNGEIKSSVPKTVQNMSNFVENNSDSTKSVQFPYFGKVVVFHLAADESEDDVVFIFPIANGLAGLPDKYVNGNFIAIATFDEVMAGAGVIGIETGGILSYNVQELIGHGGFLQNGDGTSVIDIEEDIDSDLEADLDQTEQDIQSDSELNKETSFDDGQPKQELPKAEPTASEIEAFILTNKPNFEDIPYDFPAIIAEKKETGKSWMDIASSLKESTTKLQTALTKYKKKVRDMMMGGAA